MTKAKLLIRCRAVARAGRERLRRLLRPQIEVKVGIPSAADVFGALRADLPELEGVRSAARAGDPGRARERLLAHFRNRAKPRFFVDPAEVRPLAARLASQHPAWREEALQSSAEWQRCVYMTGERSRRADEIPDWHDLPLGPGGDTVYLLKAHSCLFAIRLARACVYGAATQATLRRLIDSWVAATDGETSSPGYSSPLIAVHRAVAFTWTWAFLAGSEETDPELEFTMLRVILADARFVHARLGSSPPNNHLLADGFLLVYLGVLYPELREAEQWRRDGEALFLKELRRQIYEDGTSFEHSVHYHEFACEMVSAIVILARRNGIELPAWVGERHRRMLEFQAVLGGPGAQSFSIGDAVETHLFPLDGSDIVGTAMHRELLRSLYSADFVASSRNAPGRERAAWLLAGQLEADRQGVEDQGPRAYPDGGFLVSDDHTLHSTLVFRTGPGPGQECNPGHMHADFLSVCLRVDDVPMIVDAGTYTYRSRKERWPSGEPPWRAHFLGSDAHNTLCIEGHDPLDRGIGDFPSRPLSSRVKAEPVATAAGLTWTEARMVGDTPYESHTRGLVHVHGNYWLVYDILPPPAMMENAWLSLHFSRHASLEKQGQRAAVAAAENAQLLVVSSQEGPEIALAKGAREPVNGWVSPRYGELSPAFTLRIATKDGPKCVATLLQPISRPSGTPALDARLTDGGAVGFRISCRDQVDHLLLSRQADDRRASLFGIDFEGTAIWLRAEGARLVELRALAGTRASSKSLGFSVANRLGAGDFRLTFDRNTGLPGSRDDLDVEIARR